VTYTYEAVLRPSSDFGPHTTTVLVSSEANQPITSIQVHLVPLASPNRDLQKVPYLSIAPKPSHQLNNCEPFELAAHAYLTQHMRHRMNPCLAEKLNAIGRVASLKSKQTVMRRRGAVFLA
jgi:hypothetical protein